MAQLRDASSRDTERARSLLSQRPILLVAIVGVLLLVGISGFAGSFAARGQQDSLVERTSQDDTESERGEDGTSDEGDKIVVDVSGAVKNPCVVTLSEGDRVSDAIEAAGGLNEDADVSVLNRAAKLSDGMKITVPRVGESASSAQSDGGGETSSEASSSLININTASEDELQELSGVGPSTAAAIVQDREENGLFTSPEDLMRVSGIGEKKFAKVKDSICI